MEDHVKVISLTAIIPVDEDPQNITELAGLCTPDGDQLPRKGYVSGWNEVTRPHCDAPGASEREAKSCEDLPSTINQYRRPRAAWKSSITIWSDQDPRSGIELSELAREAETGDAICTKYTSEYIQEPGLDPDGGSDAVEFFKQPFDDEDEEGDEDDLVTDSED